MNLTDEERQQIDDASFCPDCGDGFYIKDQMYPVVESIVAARVRAAQTQALRDAAKKLHSTNSLCYPEWLIERANQLDAGDEFQNPED